MKKPIVKILAVLATVAAAVTLLLAVGGAFTAKDEAFAFGTPTYVALNTVVEGALNAPDDYEAFLYTVPQNGALSFSMEHEKRSDILDDGWHITLYKIEDDRSYTELMFTRAYLNEMTEHWGETGVTAGSYLVVIEPGRLFLAGSFSLECHYVPSDNYEKERNDTQETATPLTLGRARFGSSQGRSKGVDIDWFVLTLTEDRCVTVTFNHNSQTMPQSGWNVSVLTADGSILSDFTSRLTDSTNTSGTIGLKAGTYYVRVDSQVLSTQTYSILVSAVNPGPYEYEPNGDAITATATVSGTTVKGSLAPRLLGLDRDYYKIVLAADSVVTVSFRHDVYEGSKGGWNLRVLDSEGNELVKKVSAWNSKEIKIGDPGASERWPGGLGLKAGTYYLCVDADSLSYNNGEYALTWTAVEKAAFEAEPNNEQSGAKAISLHSYAYGALIHSDTDYDVDWYKLTLDDETNISLEFGHEKIANSSSGWTVSFINEAGKTVKEFNFYQNREKESTDTFQLPAGTYFLKVEPGLEATEDPYSLRVVG